MRIAHIGFGKTATTALQNAVFPKMAQRLGCEYINVDDLRIREHAARLVFEKAVESKIKATGSFLLSAEDLHGWDPYFWEGHADRNLRFLGADCHVLITLREPRNYLTSVYLQVCLHEGNIQHPNDFFLDRNDYSPYSCAAKFAIGDFSYQRIIDLYRKRFNRVTIVKYESLGGLLFLREMMEVDDAALEDYCKSLRTEVVNKSFSSRSVRLTKKLQRLLAVLGMSVEPNTIRGSLIALGYLRGGVKSSPMGSQLNTGVSAAHYLRWASLMHRMDRYFPSKRFELDFHTLPQIDLGLLSAEYNALPEISTFRTNDALTGL